VERGGGKKRVKPFCGSTEPKERSELVWGGGGGKMDTFTSQRTCSHKGNDKRKDGLKVEKISTTLPQGRGENDQKYGPIRMEDVFY